MKVFDEVVWAREFVDPISSISSSVLCSMVKAILGHLRTSGSRRLLWNDGLPRRGLPRLVPFFLGMGPLSPVTPS